MDSFARRRTVALVAVAALLVFAVRTLRRSSLRGPQAMPGTLARRPPQPRMQLSEAEVPEDRGYVRRLKVVELPPVGERQRVIRDAGVVAAETAPQNQRPSAFGAWLARSEIGPGQDSNAWTLPASPVSQQWRASLERPGREVNGPHADVGTVADGGGGDLSRGAAAASRAAAHAQRRLKELAASSAYPLTSEVVAAAIGAQIAHDTKIESSVRDALTRLGPNASLQAQRSAAAEVLNAEGEPSDPESVEQIIAVAAQTPPSAAALEVATKEVSKKIPTIHKLVELAKEAAKPSWRPTAPPPKNGVAAYLKYRDVFERVEREYGLKPSQVLPFPAIESAFGANTGKFPLRDTLLAIASDASGRFTPAQRKQANQDLTALTYLAASGDLGGRRIEDITGSNMGAIGITQFLTSSWRAYGRSMSGGPRDPWNFRDATLSTGNFLDHHNSRSDYDRSILSYNYSEKYKQDIKRYGQNVEPAIRSIQDNSAPR